MPTGIEKNWGVEVFRGTYSRFTHEVYAVRMTSKAIEDAQLTFLLQDLNLNFSKKIKPFMAAVSYVDNSTEINLKNYVWSIIETGNVIKLPSEVTSYQNIDDVLGSFVNEDEIERCYENVKEFVKNNFALFAERGNLKKEKIESADTVNTNNDENIDLVFNKNMHHGAFLTDLQYREQYSVENKNKSFNSFDDEKIGGKYPLAIKIDQFKSIADINLEQYQVKDVVQAFVNKGYILHGNGSKTIEKDLTLSPKTQVRCYVLDIGKN